MAKKIMKIPIGIPVLDDKFSGIYVGHVTLLTGPSGEGREIALGAAMNCYYRLNEQVMAVFAEAADRVALRVREVGYNLAKATESGALSILCHACKPGEELPVRESLGEIIAEARRSSATVLIIHDARPWLEVHPVSAAPERVAEFISTLEGSGLTSIVALPEPVSAAAKRVWGEMKHMATVALQFRRDRLGCYFMKVLNYMGLTANVPLPYETQLKFVRQQGFVKDVGFVNDVGPAVVAAAPGTVSFSRAAEPVIVDMTKTILGQISNAPSVLCVKSSTCCYTVS